MPTKSLPDNPSLEHLRKQARRLLNHLLDADPSALALLEEFHPKPGAIASPPSLADAQLILARSYGFPSWPSLKQFLAEIQPYIWNEPDTLPASATELFPRLVCLTYASFRPNPRKAAQLYSENPNLAAQSIYLAAAIGDTAAVNQHLTHNPHLANAKGGPFHWEPLLYACYSRFDSPDPDHSLLKVASLLLDRGADPNAGFLHSGTYPFTALTGAFGRGEDWNNQPPHPQWRELARLLLEKGADPNDLQALYNRHFSADNEHLRILLEFGFGRDRGGPWLPRLNGNVTPTQLVATEFARAARNGLLERIRILVEHGFNPDERCTPNGPTAYEEALKAGQSAVAQFLLNHGASPVELDPLEQFRIACISGRREEVQSRLAQDPGLVDRLGPHGLLELLHRVKHSADAIHLLLELGADLNAMVPGTHMDRTLLHNAAAWGVVPILQFLLDRGADPNLLDVTYHSSPVGWALYHGRRDNAEFLLPLTGLFDAVRFGDPARVSHLLATNPASLHAFDSAGNPLSFMISPNSANLNELIPLLTNAGINWQAPNKAGLTAIDRARHMGWTDLAALLSSQKPAS